MGMKLWGIKSHNIIKLTTYLQLIEDDPQLLIAAITVFIRGSKIL